MLAYSLYSAAGYGDYSEVRSILEEDPEIVNHQHTESGKTSLWIACAWGQDQKISDDDHNRVNHLKAIEVLLMYDANVNIADNRGKTPLFIASAWAHINAVELLLQYGADTMLPSCLEEGTNTPLHIACCLYQHKILPGANPYEKYGNYLPQQKLRSYLVAIEYMEHVMETGINIEFLPNIVEDYYNLLRCSAIIGLVETSIPDSFMDLVVYYNHFGTVAALVEHGAYVNTTNHYSNFPIHYAAESGHLAIVKMLVANYAITDEENCFGETPRDLVGHGSEVAIFLDSLEI